MEYTIDNGILSATAETFGGQLLSVRRGGTEYLWQRDPDVWGDSSPNLFPYIARLTEGKYLYDGKTYEMKIHGFVKYMELECTEHSSESMTFRLTENEETRRQYPWKFSYSITYQLQGETLQVITRVENRDEKTMYFGVGGHPGFCVPLEKALSYEDYYVSLPRAESPVRVGFTEACFRNGADAPFALKEGRKIPLSHDLFRQDAIVLSGAGQEAVLASDKGERRLTFRWDHPYLGIWSRAWEAPYVCLEPWSGLPARDGRTEDLALQEDLNRLEPGQIHESRWSVTPA